MLVFILRSAHTEVLPQTRTRVRASRRMRTGEGRVPSCFETHRSAVRVWKHLCSRRAATLLSMRAGAGGAFWRNETHGLPSGRPRESGDLGSPPAVMALLSLRSAGTTMAWPERRTNLRV